MRFPQMKFSVQGNSVRLAMRTIIGSFHFVSTPIGGKNPAFENIHNNFLKHVVLPSPTMNSEPKNCLCSLETHS